MPPLFELGRLLATPGVLGAAIGEDVLLDLVARHQQGDFGDLDAHDRQVNKCMIREGGRVLSAYRLHGSRPTHHELTIWIITDADRSKTTLLLPDEY